MAGACLVSDEQSLSPSDRDTESQPGGRDEVVFGHLHGAVQSATQTFRAFVQRTVQSAAGGGQRQRVSEEGVRLCAFESGAGQTAEGGASAVGVSVEQLSGIPQGSGAASGLAAGGPAAGGARHPEGQPGWPRAVCGADGGAPGWAEDGREYRRIRWGWCYGEEGFRKELLGQKVGRAGENQYAE